MWSPTLGGWERRRTLCSLADVAAAGERVSKATLIQTALQDMSVTLRKGTACMMRESLGRVARASGEAFQRGLEVPVAEVVAVDCQSDIGPVCIACCEWGLPACGFFSV
jgi:hypothetical protein